MSINGRAAAWWQSLRSSYWFVPTLGAILALVLWYGVDQADRHLGEDHASWIYGGSASGARELMAAVAASTITVAGVVFSVTIVTLSLASQQFGPRVLRTFMRDTGNQIVLATFIGTFLFALLVLRKIRGDDTGPAYIPGISVTTGVALAMLSVGVLVYFIHHTATSIQANRITSVVGHELEEAMGSIFPGDVRGTLRHGAPLPADVWSFAITAPVTGYVQSVDVSYLLDRLKDSDAVGLLHVRPGTFIARNDPVLSVSAMVSGELEASLKEAVAIGKVRTGAHDTEFAVEQLGQIALRALSPALNDPYTAKECLNWLGAAFSRLAERTDPPSQLEDDAGTVRLVIERPLTFERLLSSAFIPLKDVAMSQPGVATAVLDALERINSKAMDAERRGAVARLAASMADYSSLKGDDVQEISARIRALWP